VRQLFRGFEAELLRFAQQRDELVLVVAAGPAEYVALLKLVEGLDERCPGDLVWSFPVPFESPPQYARDVVALHQARIDGARASWDEGLPPLPEPPAQLHHEQASPVERVRAALVHARALMFARSDSQLLVGLLPDHAHDAEAYARFVRELLSHDVWQPWCHHMRFIVRDDVAAPALGRVLGSLPRARAFAPDLGPAAIAQSLEDEANDPSEPLPARMQSVLLLAGLDTAHGRIDDAFAKYELLLKYHRGLGNGPMVALCLNGLGEVFARAGSFEHAREFFARALRPAIATKTVPVFVNATLNLANLHREHARYAEAAEYYAAAVAIADAGANVALKLLALEQLGYCAYKRREHGAATAFWKQAIKLAQGIEALDQHLGLLLRLQAMFREVGMHDYADGIAPMIQKVEQQGGKRVPACR
jgi:tetratricopeptide (TPR) repeat protein